jgi:uncharacterized membrane protein
VKHLWIAVAAYFALVGLTAVWRWHLWTFGADTGLFAQVVSNAFGGFADGPEDGSHFRFHWSPLLASLWPLVAATHSPLALQFAQIALIAACAFPIYALTKAYLDERAAFAAASIVLLYPPLLGVAFTEFHEIAFYPVVALALFWAADRAKWGWFAVLAIVSSLVREDTCIVLAIAGLAFAAVGLLRRDGVVEAGGLLVGRPREPRALVAAGLGLAALNLAADYEYFDVVIPRLGDAWMPSHFYDYPFAHGHGPLALVSVLVQHPAFTVSLATFGRLTYALEALVPLALLPLFSPWSLLGLPGMLLLLLASEQVAWRMGGHYPSIWIPWLLIGSVATLVRWHRQDHAARVRRWTNATLALCAFFLIAFDPLHPLHYLKPLYDQNVDVRRALATIPATAHVALHDEWYTHIAYGHPHATVFVCPDVDMLVYANNFRNGYFQKQIVPEITKELSSGQARVLRRFGHVTVYARKPDRRAGYGNCKTGEYGHFATLRDFLNYSLRST